MASEEQTGAADRASGASADAPLDRESLLGRVAELERRLEEAERALAERGREVESGRPSTPGASELLERQNEMLSVLSQAQSAFIADMDARKLFEELLGSLLLLTRSEFGFIAESLTRDGQPYIRSLAASNISWNQQTRDYYAASLPTGLEFSNLKTLFGAVLLTENPVVSNNPAEDPRSGGVPEGHPPLKCFLGVPIHSGGTMVGMIGIANAPGGYDQDTIEYLMPFVRTCSGIIESYRSERRRKAAEGALRESEAKNRALLQAIPDTILRVSRDGTVLDAKISKDHLSAGLTWSLEGKSVREVLPDWAMNNLSEIEGVLSSGEPFRCEYDLTVSGERRYYESQMGPIAGAAEVLCVVRDITPRRRADAERRSLQEELIRAQAAALAEVSTPLIPINDDVVVMPLIGKVDAARAERVMETLLEGVSTKRARIAILDITGVSDVDRDVANGLVRAAQAVKLLGAEVVLTGIRAEVARALVDLDADLRTIVTRGTLQSGISYALSRV
jgi:PAS domain S-box-containing protein